MSTKENFGKVSGKISQIPKIPGKVFPGKLTENSRKTHAAFLYKRNDIALKSFFLLL